MYKIGEFSELSKTTIKTLRYYEKEGLLIPAFVDRETGYRFYETSQLPELAKIVSLRQIGLSINNIKSFLNGGDLEQILRLRKQELETEISLSNSQLLQINNLLEGKNMKQEVILKELPSFVVYYKEGVVKDFSEIVRFILQSAGECKSINPNIKCVEPDYCYISYLDGEYKEKDIKIRYAQAVTEIGVSSETIKFEKLNPVKAACIYHKGAYDNLRESYSFLLKWVEENGYEIAEPIRERYIDGMWNKESEDEWLTEIQIPIREK
ncbi:MAG: MerR family transcriptional regulator [Clostridia bacterium]